MKVLLLGDSIRMFYEKEVKTLLGKEYEVFSPSENCRFSSYMLNSLRFWLNDSPNPDIIHFNAGLWDTAILYSEDGCFVGIDEYVRNMKKVLRELKRTGAKIIFATSTLVNDKKETLPGPMPPAHKNTDIQSYNNAVLEAFKDEGILVNDLFALMYEKKEEYLCDDMIHPNDDGVKLLGKAVADAIKSVGEFKSRNIDSNVEAVSREECLLQ